MNKYMGSSTYTDNNRNPFTKMDRKKSGITDAMMENAIRNYKEKYLNCFPKYSNNTNSSSNPINPKNKHSAPHTDSDRNSFTYMNSDPNNYENNPFTNVDSNYNKSEKKSNQTKSGGYFVYVKSPLFWDEVTYTWRKRGGTITNPNNYSYLPWMVLTQEIEQKRCKIVPSRSRVLEYFKVFPVKSQIF